MAVLSLQGQEDIPRFVGMLTGGHRFILDYLVEEVLHKQTKEIQDFLLQTSILDRMNASLCNAILDMKDSQTILTQMERLNLFLVPLDYERTWYRYHHLFAELLQKQLIEIYPNEISTLHIRASHWYEEAGLYKEAISHAVLGEDFERAANLVEQNALDAFSHNQEKALANWLELLPDKILRNRPWLCVLQAYSYYWFGPRTRVEEYLQIAEQIMEQDPSDAVTPSAPQLLSVFDRKRLVGSIASIRADRFHVEGDIQGVLEQVNIALDNLEGDDRWRMKALSTVGCAYWALGDRAGAEKYFTDASAGYFRAGNWVGTVSNLAYVGIMQIKQGCLQPALRTYMEAMRRATRSDGRMMPIAGFPSIKIGDLLREWNDLSGAQEYIERGLAHATNLNQPDALVESYIHLARLRHSHNDRPGALEALEKAEQVLEKNKVDPWYLGWLDECWLRYWLSTGDLAAAVSRIERRGLTVEGPISYHHDLHHINLARVLITQGVRDSSGPYRHQAEKLLSRLQEAAEKAGWVHETIKILILEGLLFLASGKKERAVEVLARALTLAEPGGYIRIFIDEDEPMEELLSGFLASNGAGKGNNSRITVYADKLLKTLKNERKGDLSVESSGNSDMVEPLSERELEVMRFLNSHLSSVEIANELMVSPNTIRFHIKNIYSKLNVHSRSDAVQKARDLRIL
jgi:LuxR family maltose regulon positive regulatory protein